MTSMTSDKGWIPLEVVVERGSLGNPPRKVGMGLLSNRV